MVTFENSQSYLIRFKMYKKHCSHSTTDKCHKQMLLPPEFKAELADILTQCCLMDPHG